MTVVDGPRGATAAGTPEFDRTPPQDIPAEQSVLGAMMLSKDAIDVGDGVLRQHHRAEDGLFGRDVLRWRPVELRGARGCRTARPIHHSHAAPPPQSNLRSHITRGSAGPPADPTSV